MALLAGPFLWTRRPITQFAKGNFVVARAPVSVGSLEKNSRAGVKRKWRSIPQDVVEIVLVRVRENLGYDV